MHYKHAHSLIEEMPTETRDEWANCDHCNNYRMCEVTYRIYDDEEVCEKALCKYCQEK